MAFDAKGRGIKACIIGAGCSGFTMAKRLKEHNIDFDCFDMSDDIGGNWYYQNPNGQSACYQSLHIDTSKWRLAFEDYPVPDNWPDFPHHSQILQYFRDYIDHFDLRSAITFNTAVKTAKRAGNRDWDVTLSSGETRRYQWLFVANGHHWDPRIPDDYPGQSLFSGYQIHSHTYRDPFAPYDFRDKRVLVVGAGNSAMDIASELSQRPIAERLIVSMRRGVWVLPKYLSGQPADKVALPAWLPSGLGRRLARSRIKKEIGQPESYGLPKPDHEPLDAHPSVSGEFLTRVGCGDIIAKGAIKAFTSSGVVFADGSEEALDAIIWATGYNVTFPFFAEPELTPKANALPLFKRMIRPGFENVIFLGLAQPLPTLVNLAEQQAKLAAELILERYELPDRQHMARIIEADAARHMGHFYHTARHTMQIDFNIYVRDLYKEIERGKQRVKRFA